ncbi:acyltransferase family protein [Hymenobacter baengnokdamensis]|uniref:acyltransferase family protein n=1 Tax=Hymenobacter baengnokdamensis TaxID=2615203 RepID=UPI001243DF24|nr:acyltransferase [Hymenobacter baengnokdamensis]
MEPEPHRAPIRFYEIDLLRFLAALAVVVYHYTFLGQGRPSYNPLVFREISGITRYGYLGVELFFIISGYVVLLSAQGKTVRQFFVSRVMRLYPAYWAACTLTFLVKIMWGSAAYPGAGMAADLQATVGQYVYNLTMLQDLIGVRDMDGPYWSLAIEITFYFLISVLIGYKLLPRIDWFLAGWLLYAGLPHLAYSGPLFTTLFIRGYAPYFIAGMLFYLMQQPQGRTWGRYLMLSGAYVLAIRSCRQNALELTGVYHSLVSPFIVTVVVTGFFLLFALISFRWLNLSRFTWLTWLGALTYPLYLIHSDIAFVLFFHSGSGINKYVMVLGTLALMLALAYLIHVAVEKRYSRQFGAWLTARLAKLD